MLDKDLAFFRSLETDGNHKLKKWYEQYMITIFSSSIFPIVSKW